MKGEKRNIVVGVSMTPEEYIELREQKKRLASRSLSQVMRLALRFFFDNSMHIEPSQINKQGKTRK